MQQAELLRRAVEVLESQQIPYMLVGSFASMAYGEPRLTQDIDIVVNLGPAQLDSLCAAFPEADFYVSRAAARQAVSRGGQFKVIHPASGNKIDFMLVRRDEWGRAQFARRRSIAVLPDLTMMTASPEDVILGKLWYYQEGGSEKHLRDVAAMIQVSGEIIDKNYIADWSRQLGLTEIWQAVLTRLAQKWLDQCSAAARRGMARRNSPRSCPQLCGIAAEDRLRLHAAQWRFLHLEHC